MVIAIRVTLLSMKIQCYEEKVCTTPNKGNNTLYTEKNVAVQKMVANSIRLTRISVHF